MAIEMLCRFTPGAEGVVEASLIPTLVDKLKVELDEIKVRLIQPYVYIPRLRESFIKKILCWATTTWKLYILFNEWVQALK